MLAAFPPTFGLLMALRLRLRVGLRVRLLGRRSVLGLGLRMALWLRAHVVGALRALRAHGVGALSALRAHGVGALSALVAHGVGALSALVAHGMRLRLRSGMILSREGMSHRHIGRMPVIVVEVGALV